MNLDIEDGVELIITSFKNDRKDKAYQQYVILYPYMNKDNFISFDDYFEPSTRVIKKENKEEINNKVNTILKVVCKN